MEFWRRIVYVMQSVWGMIEIYWPHLLVIFLVMIVIALYESFVRPKG